MARPHIEPYCELNEGWKKLDLRGFPRGSEYKVLSMDRDTGACSLKMRLQPGYRRPPGLSYSDIELFVQTSPGFCCPSLVTEAMARDIERATGVPVVSITYDGTGKPMNEALVPYLSLPRSERRRAGGGAPLRSAARS